MLPSGPIGSVVTLHSLTGLKKAVYKSRPAIYDLLLYCYYVWIVAKYLSVAIILSNYLILSNRIISVIVTTQLVFANYDFHLVAIFSRYYQYSI